MTDQIDSRHFTSKFESVYTSVVVDVSTPIELTPGRREQPHIFVGAQFFSDAGGTTEVVPSGGSIAYNLKPITTNQYEPFPKEIVQADTPETVSVSAPPVESVRATPSAIAGATHWRIIVASYAQAQ